jgi:hypothetical protein
MGNTEQPAQGPGLESRSLSRLWHGFNRWRCRRWHVRVLILLLIFSSPLYERLSGDLLIVRLTRIACDAVQLASQPSVAWYKARYYRSQEFHRLQWMLRREFDSNRNGQIEPAEADRASKEGIESGLLTRPSVDADLGEIADMAKQIGLLPLDYSAAGMEWQAYCRARAEADLMDRRERREIDALLERRDRWPDYTRWKTWERGLAYFLQGLDGMVSALAPAGTRHCRILGAVLCGGLGAAMSAAGWVAVMSARPDADMFFWFPEIFTMLEIAAHCLALACLSAASGSLGARSVAVLGKSRRKFWMSLGVAGLFLGAWGTSRWLRCLNLSGWHALMTSAVGPFWLDLPRGLSLVAQILGVAAIITAAVMLSWPHFRRGPSGPTC